MKFGLTVFHQPQRAATKNWAPVLRSHLPPTLLHAACGWYLSGDAVFVEYCCFDANLAGRLVKYCSVPRGDCALCNRVLHHMRPALQDALLHLLHARSQVAAHMLVQVLQGRPSPIQLVSVYDLWDNLPARQGLLDAHAGTMVHASIWVDARGRSDSHGAAWSGSLGLLGLVHAASEERMQRARRAHRRLAAALWI